VPAIAAAQAAFPTEWPNGAQPLSPEALRQQLVGKTFVAKSLTSPPVRTQYQEEYVYINIGSTSDSGTWKTEDRPCASNGERSDPLARKSRP